MSTGRYLKLTGRSIVTVAGEDRLEFLQGLVSNDVSNCGPERSIWSALLTPQGKYLHDFFMADQGDRYWLDCEAGRMMDLGQRLHRYKLRSQVDLDIGKGLGIYAVLHMDEDPFDIGSAEPGAGIAFADGMVFRDPRLAAMGYRVIGSPDKVEAAFDGLGILPLDNSDEYDRVRIPLGLPDGSRDMVVEKATLLENGFGELGGVDWQKGCYMGQELTARMKYRGLVKKRLLPFRANVPLADAPGPITADGKEVGEVFSSTDGWGLALVRLDRWRKAVADGTAMVIGEEEVFIQCPDWVELPEEAASA